MQAEQKLNTGNPKPRKMIKLIRDSFPEKYRKSPLIQQQFVDYIKEDWKTHRMIVWLLIVVGVLEIVDGVLILIAS